MKSGNHRLRDRAEQLLGTSSKSVERMAIEDVQALVHELQVHQIELEMQNEELRDSRLELEASRDRYFDLYEFSPAGYLTLDPPGTILEANLTAATLLGTDRRELTGSKLSRFIDTVSQDTWYLHREQVCATGTKKTCELVLVRKDRTLVHVQAQSVLSGTGDPLTGQIWTSLIDVTERKRAEDEVCKINEELDRRVVEQSSRLIENERSAATASTVGRVANEIGNPLNGIYMMLQLLERQLAHEGNLDARAVATVLGIKTEVEHLNTLFREFRSPKNAK